MDLPKPLSRLLSAKTLSEAIVRNGYPYLKMWEKILEATREEIKEWLSSQGPIHLTDTSELVLETSQRENFSKNTIIEAVGKVEADLLFTALRQKGAFKTILVTSMVERTKK